MSLTTAPGDWLARAVTGADTFEHLRALQQIADRHAGSRAVGTPGFAASRDYVVDALTTAGYLVTQQDAPYTCFAVSAEHTRTAGPHAEPLLTLLMDQSPPLPPVVAPVAALAGGRWPASGCEPGDYQGHDVRGAVVLLARASCGYERQLAAAAAAGARAVLLYTITPSPDNVYRLHWFGTSPPPIPLASIPQSQAERLAGLARAGPVPLFVDWQGSDVDGVTQNILAETAGGSPDRVVIAGAHLDSVTEGPGINDNGSGAAAILQAAIKLASWQDTVRNRARFIWWGTEELVDVGSAYYIAGLTSAQRQAICIYLNAEMLGSANFARFVMQGRGVVTAPFDTYFRQQRLAYEYLDVHAVGSDHEPFLTAGIPVGGLFGGAMGIKTAAQMGRYGGTADQMHDPFYHQPGDTLPNISQLALDGNARALAYAIGQAAMDAGSPLTSGKPR